MNFFNKVTDAVGTMGKDVTKAAKDNVEIMKCSSAIDSREKEMESIYKEIGRRYYNSEGEVSKEAFADLFEAIRSEQSQIDELREKLQELKRTVICKECGAELPRDAKYCRNCGAKTENIIITPFSGETCSKCHSPLKGNEKFCAVCGTKVEHEKKSEEQTTGIFTKQPLTCSVCGRELKDTDVYCKSCGNSVK